MRLISFQRKAYSLLLRTLPSIFLKIIAKYDCSKCCNLEPCTILQLIRSQKLVGDILNRRFASKGGWSSKILKIGHFSIYRKWLPPWGHGVTFSTHVADERITSLKEYVVFNYRWLKTAPSSLYNLFASWIPSGGGTSWSSDPRAR